MTDALLTIRDHLRYAVTAFTRAGLSFGHGATNAVDEAAFMILEGLSLPIDDINPFLDARLEPVERERLAALIRERVRTRKPAAYLLRKAYVQGVPFYVDERVIVPRSYIGEILGAGALFLPKPEDVRSVLDLCTGSGCLAVLAAHAFPQAKIEASDISEDALAVARRNIAEHGLEGRIDAHHGDLFAPLGGRRFDLILANPPYVDAAAVADFPPEYRAEPPIAHAGGEDGLDIVRRIIAEAPAFLNPGGGLLCEIGRGRTTLESAFPRIPFDFIDTEESEGEVFFVTREALRA